MISLIIFGIACAVIYTSNLFALGGEMTFRQITWIFLAAVIGMVIVNGLVATICCKLLPDKWFKHSRGLFSAGRKETRLYEKLGIKKWKDKTLELGVLNNFKKDKIEAPNNPEYVEQFIIENNKGFTEHLISIFVSFAVIFIMPKKFWLPMGLPIAITSAIINGMAVMILRYNMPRLKTLLRYTQRNLNKQQEDVKTP